MQPYKIIEIFIGEEARWHGQALHSAIVQWVHNLKIAARCMVVRGIEGSYESGEIATQGLEVLSYNMPLRVTIVLPASESGRVLAHLQDMVTEGIIAVQDIYVASHKVNSLQLPRHTRVADMMTKGPQKVGPETSLDEVARILLSSTFTGLPVVDDKDRPVGVISQGDLIYRAGMPMRLGLLAESDQGKVDAVLRDLAVRQAKEVMTRPVVMIDQDEKVTEAVNLMVQKQVKRLPVIDGEGRLVGILSRLDIFHSILRECPDWQAFQRHKISVANLRCVSDIMRRDTITVSPETSVEEVLRLIDCNDIQRLAVVDQDGYFLGLISDRDLLIAFSEPHQGMWDYFASKMPFTDRARAHRRLQEHLPARTAQEVMKTDIITVQEDASIQEAIRLMLERSIKRLPVLDAHQKFKGMVSREELLRFGFGADQSV